MVGHRGVTSITQAAVGCSLCLVWQWDGLVNASRTAALHSLKPELPEGDPELHTGLCLSGRQLSGQSLTCLLESQFQVTKAQSSITLNYILVSKREVHPKIDKHFN